MNAPLLELSALGITALCGGVAAVGGLIHSVAKYAKIRDADQLIGGVAFSALTTSIFAFENAYLSVVPITVAVILGHYASVFVWRNLNHRSFLRAKR